MKKIYLMIIAIAVLFLFVGCNEITSELKTRNEELRIQNASLQAQVQDLDRQLKACKEAAVKQLYKYDPSVTNPDDDQGF